MKVFVSGAAGYIGSKLVSKLLTQGHQVKCLDNLMYGPESLMSVADHKNCDITVGDARDKELVKELTSSCDVVIPLACLTGAPLCKKDPLAASSTNKDAIIMLNDICSSQQLIVYPCTNSGYGIGQDGIYCTEDSPLQPLSLYGRDKVEAEKALLDSGNAITFRLATVFGLSPRPRLDLLVNDFCYRAFYDRALVLFESHFKRNYLHIDDAVDGFIFAMNNAQLKGNCYNLGYSEANLSKYDLCMKIKEYLPEFVFFNSEIGQDPDKRNYIVSNEKIESAGFKATRSLDLGIQQLISSMPLLKRNSFANI